MQQVAAEAQVAGESRLQARALTALSEMALFRDADADAARRLIEEAREVLGDDDDVDARFDVFSTASLIASWRGDRAEFHDLGHEALEFVRSAERKDLEAIVIQGLAQDAIVRLDVVEAESLVRQAAELAEASGSVRARAAALGTQAWLDEIQGRGEAAEHSYRELLQLYTDIGNVTGAASTQMYLGRLLQHNGQAEKAEALLREAVKTLKRVGDRGHLCEAQRFLAQTLVARGKIDEAERVALQAIESVGTEDQLSIWTTQMALGVVRAAQGRDDEAEQLLRDSVEGFVDNGLRFAELQAIDELVKFLRARGRLDEAEVYEERAAALGPVASSTERIA
jgi:tetratricopeptide (TPR) repeat protein